MNVAVVIPIYQTALNEHERLSLERTTGVLSSHPTVVVCPEGLDLSPLGSLLQPAKPQVRRFRPDYFHGLAGYNRLMLSEEFYAALDYGHILICQLDVFVFQDRLDYWCAKGYDYIGAPWIASKQTRWRRVLHRVNRYVHNREKRTDHFFKVGNGGFSLRNVAVMRRAVARRRQLLQECTPDDLDRANLDIEDRFFSLLAPTLTDITIPDYVEAVDFCMDRKPQIALQLNQGRLPFACHRFYDPKVRSFWDPIIRAHLRR